LRIGAKDFEFFTCLGSSVVYYDTSSGAVMTLPAAGGRVRVLVSAKALGAIAPGGFASDGTRLWINDSTHDLIAEVDLARPSKPKVVAHDREPGGALATDGKYVYFDTDNTAWLSRLDIASGAVVAHWFKVPGYLSSDLAIDDGFMYFNVGLDGIVGRLHFDSPSRAYTAYRLPPQVDIPLVGPITSS
jgi:hypothetical protein